jgi:hypothetical protein
MEIRGYNRTVMNTRKYPNDPQEWREAINEGLGLAKEDGKIALAAGEFPFDALEDWIKSQYSEGYSPDFVLALVRNIRGLVAWVYGGEGEPFWPGSDEDSGG